MDLTRAIDAQLRAALLECCSPAFVSELNVADLPARVHATLLEDALAFAAKDPASGNDPIVVVQSYTSWRAVLHYRLAHAVWAHASHGNLPACEGSAHARLIASRGKFLSGAEIDHRCRIGPRFVLDHGVGTVIGETTTLGSDCYVLGGVVLGASGIASNSPTRRHPEIGDRVQIGAFARILGPVRLGDDVFIGTHCTVTQDVADRTRVVLRAQQELQVVQPVEHCGASEANR